jgi:hypothetical protein
MYKCIALFASVAMAAILSASPRIVTVAQSGAADVLGNERGAAKGRESVQAGRRLFG